MVKEGGEEGVLGKYELGRALGEGNFGKVKYARHVVTGQAFAVKILDRKRIQSLKIDDQIKREIGTLKLLKHPNVVRLHEGTNCRLNVRSGTGHRRWVRRVSVLPSGVGARHNDGLLHTTCGSPNYIAPEVISTPLPPPISAGFIFQVMPGLTSSCGKCHQILSNRGYDGARSDIWSCGVILYVILTGYLPFDDRNLAVLYQKRNVWDEKGASPTHINAFQLIGMASSLDLSGFFETE
ncbi:hypothetical protein GW17_00059550, partial [Ensete ventricosum]